MVQRAQKRAVAFQLGRCQGGIFTSDMLPRRHNKPVQRVVDGVLAVGIGDLAVSLAQILPDVPGNINAAARVVIVALKPLVGAVKAFAGGLPQFVRQAEDEQEIVQIFQPVGHRVVAQPNIAAGEQHFRQEIGTLAVEAAAQFQRDVQRILRQRWFAVLCLRRPVEISRDNAAEAAVQRAVVQKFFFRVSAVMPATALHAVDGQIFQRHGV